MKDYRKLLPHLDAIKEVIEYFEGEDRETMLRLLIQDALSENDAVEGHEDTELVDDENHEHRDDEGWDPASDENEVGEEDEDEEDDEDYEDDEDGDEDDDEDDDSDETEDTEEAMLTKGRGFFTPSEGQQLEEELSNGGHVNSTLVGSPSIENIRAFLNEFKLNDYVVRNLFVIGENEVMRAYSDLGTDVRTRAQIKAVLLGCLAGAIETGEFKIALKRVRNECKELGVYDSNFPSNLARAHEYFYNTDSKREVELSDAGLLELVSILKKFNER